MVVTSSLRNSCKTWNEVLKRQCGNLIAKAFISKNKSDKNVYILLASEKSGFCNPNFRNFKEYVAKTYKQIIECKVRDSSDLRRIVGFYADSGVSGAFIVAFKYNLETHDAVHAALDQLGVDDTNRRLSEDLSVEKDVTDETMSGFAPLRNYLKYEGRFSSQK